MPSSSSCITCSARYKCNPWVLFTNIQTEASLCKDIQLTCWGLIFTLLKRAYFNSTKWNLCLWSQIKRSGRPSVIQFSILLRRNGLLYCREALFSCSYSPDSFLVGLFFLVFNNFFSVSRFILFKFLQSF